MAVPAQAGTHFSASREWMSGSRLSPGMRLNIRRALLPLPHVLIAAASVQSSGNGPAAVDLTLKYITPLRAHRQRSLRGDRTLHRVLGRGIARRSVRNNQPCGYAIRCTADRTA